MAFRPNLITASLDVANFIGMLVVLLPSDCPEIHGWYDSRKAMSKISHCHNFVYTLLVYQYRIINFFIDKSFVIMFEIKESR